MPARTVVATAPSRIDLAGGTLDIWPLSVLVPDAITVNVAIGLRARVTVRALRTAEVVIRSEDRRRTARRRLPLSAGDIRGPLSLVLRQVAAFAPRGGLEITTVAEAPAGAGLGGSSTLGIALGAALARYTGTKIDRATLLRRVMNLETALLGVPTGNQDYLAAVHGGLAAYHHRPDGTERESIALPDGLERRIVLAYTGQPRHSGFSNWDMFRRYVDGEPDTVRKMRAIAAIAREMRGALIAADLDAVGRLVGREGRLRDRLAPSVSTPALASAARAGMRAGALGVKVCGAGGGGCLVAVAREGKAVRVAAAIAGTGAEILPARISRSGVRVSERRSES